MAGSPRSVATTQISTISTNSGPGFFAAFPDLRCTIDDLIAEGDRVAWHLTCPGTHRGAFLGVAPTGRQFVAQAFEFGRSENGKPAEHWGGPDVFNLLQQLGAAVR